MSEFIVLSTTARGLLCRLKVASAQDLSRVPAVRILTQPDGTEEVFREIQRFLQARGLSFAKASDSMLLDVRRDAPESDWGCLYLWEARLRDVRAAVVTAYKEAGCVRSRSEPPIGIPPLKLNRSETLTDDELRVVPDRSRWVSVESRTFEWASPGGHPLARALSVSYEVVSVTSVEGRYGEIAVYRQGALAEISLAGPRPPEAPPAAPLDLARFVERSKRTPENLRSSLAHPDQFIAFAGLSRRGYRNGLQTAPHDDHPEGSWIVLRKRRRA